MLDDTRHFAMAFLYREFRYMKCAHTFSISLAMSLLFFPAALLF